MKNKKAKSRVKKQPIKALIAISMITSGLWFGVFYSIEQIKIIQKPIIIKKIETKEIEKVEDFVPSSKVLGCIEKRPGVAGSIKRKFGKKWRYWAELIGRESCLNPSALNTSSGACGLGQALPCKKMDCPLNMDGVDCQLDWIEQYVTKRYKTIQHAIVFHDVMNWY